MLFKIFDVLLKFLKYSPLIVLSIIMLFFASLALQYRKDYRSEHSKLVNTQQEYQQLSSTLAELQVNYSSLKTLEAKEKADWSKEEKDLKGQIQAIADASFSISGFTDHQDKPDLVTKDFLEQEVHFYSKDGLKGPPFGFVKIMNGTGATSSGPYAASINVKAAVTKEANGRSHVLVKSFWSMNDDTSLSPEWKGKPWPLEITGGDFYIDPDATITSGTMRNKFWSVSHLNMGLYAGTSPGFTYGFHGDVSFFGYGKTKNDLDWKLLGVGVNASKDHFDINLSPIKYRIGNQIPLAEDLYIGAGAGIGFTAYPTYFITLDSTL